MLRWWFELNKILQGKVVGPKNEEFRQETGSEQSEHITVFSGGARLCVLPDICRRACGFPIWFVLAVLRDLHKGKLLDLRGRGGSNALGRRKGSAALAGPAAAGLPGGHR